MTLTDEQLINALRKSDAEGRRAALQWLCYDSTLLEMARSVLLRMNAREADFEDILQEARIAFLRAIECGRFERRSSLRTFYIGICRNIMLKRYAPGTEPADISELPLSGSDAGVEQRIVLREEREERERILQHLFQQLGEKCAEALSLYNRGFPMDHISADMGYGQVQSAKNVVHKCRERFRVLLTQNEAAVKIIKSRS